MDSVWGSIGTATFAKTKLGLVVRMDVGSILPLAECGPNDHRKDAPPFIYNMISWDWLMNMKQICIWLALRILLLE